MNEQAYERHVEHLVDKWGVIIEKRAAAAVDRHRHEDPDDCFALAREDVETSLLHSNYWEKVEAVDISDIAGEFVNRAIRESY